MALLSHRISSLLFAMVVWFSTAYCYNLDTLVPTIVESGLPPDALLGFSVEQHEFSDGRKIVLAGAPKDTVDGIVQGSVWECPLQHQANCTRQLAFNSRENADTSPFPNTDKVVKQENEFYVGQKMGFNIRSFEDRVLACAPLFVFSINMITSDASESITSGRCVDLPQDFTNSTIPYQFIDSSYALSGVGLGRGRLDSEPNIIVGNIFLQSGTGDFRGGEVATGVIRYDAANPSYVDRYTFTSQSGLNDDEYLGYHIETGNFTGISFDEVIVSAPRAANHQGTITILNAPNSALGSLLPIQRLTGPGGADTYFGIDFAVIDFKNANGRHSVVVGCPLCNRDRGAILVYLNTGDNAAPLNLTQEFRLPGQQRAWFGLSVENIGDTDRDGFDDIAVGAPFRGNGAVFIFRGTQSGLMLDEYQVITPPTSYPDNSGFGYSLAGGLDMDNNGYADITVGSSGGGLVTSIRSAPMVTVIPSFMEENITINSADRNCTVNGVSLACFQIVPCFRYTTVTGYVPQFAIQFTLTVDSLFRRVGLYNPSGIGPFRVEESITITNGSERTCAAPLEFALRSDFTTTDPFPINLTVSSVPNPISISTADSEQFGGALHPVLRRFSSGSTPLSLTAMTMATTEFTVSCGNDSVCDPNYTIGAQLDGSVNEVFLAAGERFSYDVTISNTNEAGFTAYLDVATPAVFILDRAESLTQSALATGRCDSNRCMLKNPIFSGETIRLRLTFRPNIAGDPGILSLKQVTVNFTVGANETALVSTNLTVNTRSMASYSFITSTGSNVVQAMRITPSINTSTSPIASIGPELTYQITVTNSLNDTVASPIPRTVVTIVWPSVFIDQQGVRSPLLVPERINVGANTACRELGAIPRNLLRLEQYDSNIPQLPANVSGLDIQRNCMSSNASNISCGVIQCVIETLQPSSADTPVIPSTIIIQSRLWSPSVRRGYTVDVYATIESSSEYPTITDSTANQATTITLLPAVQEIAVNCFLGWVIIISIVGGLLLLLLILLILTMFGKFGRDQYNLRQQKQDLRQKQEQTDTGDNGVAHHNPALIMPTARTIPPQGAFASSQLEKEAEAEKQDEALAEQEKEASKQLAEYLEPKAEYYDEDQVETEI